MHKILAVLVFSVSILSFQTLAHADTQPAPALKDWTFLVYMNGDNNLDPYTTTNLIQMEKVGSTDQINIVVQWASSAAGKTRRLLVQKENDSTDVTSPILQDMGVVDMGDFHNLQSFIEWGAKTYPAQHYFVDVWDHGSGWHQLQMQAQGARGKLHMNDISWDDGSGNHMTTIQLAQALKGASATIGQKIDLYGSDACLMAMAEVADELSPAVGTFVGSEEVEPAAGWPYTELLTRWSALESSTKGGAAAQDIAKILVEEYVKSYSNGSNGSSEVTSSAFDLTKIDALNAAITSFGTKIIALSAADKTKALTAAQGSQSFTDLDYVDLQDFLTNLEKQSISSLDRQTFADVHQAISDFVIADSNTDTYNKAKGMTIWLPSDSSTLSTYSDQYKTMKFNGDTHWLDALTALNAAQPAPQP